MSGTLRSAQTPALVIDRSRLQANCERMKSRCRVLGLKLRPHMKTLKSVETARLATDGRDEGIAVATLHEAEYFAGHGFTDVQLAVCIPPDKLPRAASILEKAPRFSFFLDSRDVAEAVAEFSRTHHARLRVWIEVDSGEHRTGVEPEDPALVEIARVLRESAAVFEGVATHAGHSYKASTAEELRAIAEQERLALTKAAVAIQAAGINCPEASAGSTPTAVHAVSGEGLTELRAGVYMTGDLYQVSIGSLPLDDVALTVLATVISHNRGRNQIVIDAGGLALSKDRSTAAGPGPDMGYGLVLDVSGRSLGGLTIAEVHQEHGEIQCPADLIFDELPIGARVRVVPNHACMTAAMYDRYLVIAGAETIVDVWRRTNGWA